MKKRIIIKAGNAKLKKQAQQPQAVPVAAPSAPAAQCGYCTKPFAEKEQGTYMKGQWLCGGCSKTPPPPKAQQSQYGYDEYPVYRS